MPMHRDPQEARVLRDLGGKAAETKHLLTGFTIF